MKRLKIYLSLPILCLAAVLFVTAAYASDQAMDSEINYPEILSISSTPSGIQITWQLVEGAESYNIFRKKGNGSWYFVNSTDSRTTQYTDSLIFPNVGYSYTIKALNADQQIIGGYDLTDNSVIWEIEISEIAAGTELSPIMLEQLGEDQFFYVEEISDELFDRMWGKSYKENCTVPREDLRYIRCLHCDIEGKVKVGELVMNKIVADTVCDIFRQLYKNHFPIESMLLVDDFDASDEDSIMHNNTSAFNFRTVDNTDQISNHAYGLAIDINPYYNVYYIPSENYIFPEEDGWKYLDREADFPYKVAPGDLCYQLFTDAGFEWGGWWTYNTDYQHFQYVTDITY